MTLKVTLKPNERIVVNGCVIRNSQRRNTLIFESHADIVRESDLLDEGAQATPVAKAYFLVQTALIRADLRDKVVPVAQKHLGRLAACFAEERRLPIFEAANYVSIRDYYKALRALRPLLRYEAELLAASQATARQVAEAEAQGAEPA